MNVEFGADLGFRKRSRVAALTVWNSLPRSLRLSDSIGKQMQREWTVIDTTRQRKTGACPLFHQN